ncbi:hypothetical protein NHQ30_009991 [Ciborinia camelliae]|nr:hypothetical protein NHQ30_009991 [Ciborinia camelliae]
MTTTTTSTTTTSPFPRNPETSTSTATAFPHPFPARSKTATGLVGGTQTDVSCMYFADRILVTLCQGGRLGQWIQIPLTSVSPTSYETMMALPSSSSSGLGFDFNTNENENANENTNAKMILPLEHLTPRTLLGAGGEERERRAHLYATQIASMILGRDMEERRTVLVGLGLEMVGREGGEDAGREREREREREGYFDLLELVGGVL